MAPAGVTGATREEGTAGTAMAGEGTAAGVAALPLSIMMAAGTPRGTTQGPTQMATHHMGSMGHLSRVLGPHGAPTWGRHHPT